MGGAAGRAGEGSVGVRGGRSGVWRGQREVCDGGALFGAAVCVEGREVCGAESGGEWDRGGGGERGVESGVSDVPALSAMWE